MLHKRFCVLTLAIALAFVACGEDDRKPRGTTTATGGADPGPPTTATGQWVEELLIGAEVGNDQQIVHRWNRSPSIVVVGDPNLGMTGDPLDASLQTINAIIADSGVVLSVGSTPDISLYVGTPSELDDYKVAEMVPGGFSGTAFAWWTTAGALTHVVLLVDSGNASEIVITQALARALGVLGSSDIFADSMFATNVTTAPINSRDAMLLEFLYTQVEPGHVVKDVRIAFNAWWPNPE